MDKQEMHDQILALVKKYGDSFGEKEAVFQEGKPLRYAGRVYDGAELVNLVDSALEFWLTASHYVEAFEKGLGEYLGIRYVSAVGSGSSANLVAFMALTSPLLKDRQIRRGDEVITVAAGFPTTVSPIVNYGAVPVFVDVTIPGYNIDTSKLEEALSPKTKAVMLAHTLGNPFDLKTVKDFCHKQNLWLIEDNCDALGATYTLRGAEHFTGTVGDIGTSSFYPAHHITMGEGGAVYTNDPLLHKIIRSIRDWGRDCTCTGGRDNSCGHRFDGQYGKLPMGYDHKYVYSHFGYNLKITEMQGAIGCAQLKKLPAFVEKRRANFDRLRQKLEGLEEMFILPEVTENAKHSPFGFLLTCKEQISRDKVVRYLEGRGIQTRMLFAGNLIKHPCFDTMRNQQKGYRIGGTLENTDRIMRDTFWLGVYPGLTDAHIDFMAKSVREAAKIYGGL